MKDKSNQLEELQYLNSSLELLILSPKKESFDEIYPIYSAKIVSLDERIKGHLNKIKQLEDSKKFYIKQWRKALKKKIK